MSPDAELMSSLWDDLLSTQRRYVTLMAGLEQTQREVRTTYARMDLLTRSIGILDEGRGRAALATARNTTPEIYSGPRASNTATTVTSRRSAGASR
jgi:hypothetical protein